MGKELESIEIEVVSTKKDNKKDIPVKEWIPAKVNKVTKIKRREDWNDELEFEFELAGDFRPLRAWGHVTLYASPGSKLYEWYCGIMNVNELKEGETIRINDLIGKLCYVMLKYKKFNGEVVISKNGNKQAKVVEVKFRESDEIEEDEVVPEIVSSVKEQEEDYELSDDIEIEEINIDDLDDIKLEE